MISAAADLIRVARERAAETGGKIESVATLYDRNREGRVATFVVFWPGEDGYAMVKR